MKGSVRFKETPSFLGVKVPNTDESASSTLSDNLDLLNALTEATFETYPDEGMGDKTVFEDSIYNRDNFIGRTPHSKVVDAQRSRKALQELMVVPTFKNVSSNTIFNETSSNIEVSKSAKTPFRRTPGPIKVRGENLSLQQFQNDGSGLQEPSFYSSVGSGEVRVSSCSPRHERGSSSGLDPERVNSSTSDSPLSNLICRPEISKSSPMVFASSKPIMVDAGTSYSPCDMVESSAQTSFQSVKEPVPTSTNTMSTQSNTVASTDLPSTISGMLAIPSTPLNTFVRTDENKHHENVVRMSSNGIIASKLVQEGGVSLGKGPLVPSISQNVASLKQVVHHVAAAHPVEAVSRLPQINHHPNQFSITVEEKIGGSNVSMEFPSKRVTVSAINPELEAIQPALHWVPAKNTRKFYPATADIAYYQTTNPLNFHTDPYPALSNDLGNSKFNAPNVVFNVGVQLDNATNKEDSPGSEADRSQTLEELISHDIIHVRKDPLDFTECNIGGTPSTIMASSTGMSVSRPSNEGKHIAKYSVTPSSTYSSATFFSPALLSSNLTDRSRMSLPAPAPASRLGRARRLAEGVTTYSDVESSNSYSITSESDQLDSESHQLIGFENSHKGKVADITVLTDVAVATFTRDQYSVDYDNDSEIMSHVSTSLETTMTLDKSQMLLRHSSHSSPSLKSPYPRLAIKSLKRDQENPFDVKEIGFETAPNELMTIMLSFKNNHKRHKSISLVAKTIFLRVEPLYHQRSHSKGLAVATVTNDPNDSVFIVSPEQLEIANAEEGMLFITFAPTEEGIYSGALKIKYQRKSFTLLLRGECNHRFQAQPPQYVDNHEVIPIEKNPPPASLKISNCEQQQQLQQYHNNQSIFKSTPETLQSFPRTEGEGSHFTPSLEEVDGSPRAFQHKLSELQKKIGEISRKISIKESNITSLSGISNHSATFTLPPRPPKQTEQKLVEQIVYTFPTSSVITGSATSTERPSPSIASSAYYLADTEKSHQSTDNFHGKLDFVNRSSIHTSALQEEYHNAQLIKVSTHLSSSNEQQQHQVTLEQQKLASHHQQQQVIDQEDYILNSTRKKGLFFRKSIERFGYTMIGSLVRTKILMCNASHHEMTVYLGDLQPPFYCHHNQLVMKPKSFLRLPVRFIPTVPGEYVQELIAQSEDGKNQAMVELVGIAAAATPFKQ